MAKAVYRVMFIHPEGERPILEITDLYSDRKPTMSVTNDIDDVLAEIEELWNVNLENYRIIVHNTNNLWDSIKVTFHEKGTIPVFNWIRLDTSREEAIKSLDEETVQ